MRSDEPALNDGQGASESSHGDSEARLEKALSKLSVIYRANSKISSLKSVEDVFRQTLQELATSFNAEICLLFACGGHDDVLQVADSFGVSKGDITAADLTLGASTTACQTGVTVMGSSANEAINPFLAEKYGAQETIAVPLVVSGRLRYIIQLYRLYPTRFETDDIQFLKTLLTHVSISVAAVEAKEENERSLSLFNSLIESITDGVVVTDTSNRIFRLNSGILQMFGLSGQPQDFTGLTAESIIERIKTLLTDPEQFVRRLHEITDARRNVRDEIIPLNDGRSLSRDHTSILTGQGRYGGDLRIYSDVTREVEIDRMKSDFIGVAVHQLKTPLTALKWAVEMLSDSAKSLTDEEEKDLKDTIAEVTRRLNELVSSLLNVTRIESGRLSVEPKPTNLAALAAEVIKENALAAQAKKQEIVLDPEAGLPDISVDPRLVGEIFKNLLTNAIKYSPEGGRIEVRLEKKEHEIISSVKDHGYGIPERQQKRVFEKFFRADNIIGRPEDGTGLGVYFAKQVVEASGGRIWFESTEGTGTTFSFSLPLAGSQTKQGVVRLG